MTVYFSDNEVGYSVSVDLDDRNLGHRSGVIKDVSPKDKSALVLFDDPVNIVGSQFRFCVVEARGPRYGGGNGTRFVPCFAMLVPVAKEELPNLLDLLTWWRGGMAFEGDLSIVPRAGN